MNFTILEDRLIVPVLIQVCHINAQPHSLAVSAGFQMNGGCLIVSLSKYNPINYICTARCGFECIFSHIFSFGLYYD